MQRYYIKSGILVDILHVLNSFIPGTKLQVFKNNAGILKISVLVSVIAIMISYNFCCMLTITYDWIDRTSYWHWK